MDETMLMLLKVMAIAVVLFFVLREVNLWYWKINKRIELMEKQNVLLESIFKQLGGSFEKALTEEDKKEVEKIKEANEVEKIKKTIKDNEVIVKVIATGKIEKWNVKDWQDVVKGGNESKFKLI